MEGAILMDFFTLSPDLGGKKMGPGSTNLTPLFEVSLLF
jgi:hypothetical protein